MTQADIDGEVFDLIESTGFKTLCGELFPLRNLLRLGYGQEDAVKNEIESVLGLIQKDDGFRCISIKKINDPRKRRKSCARLKVEYGIPAAGRKLHLRGCGTAFEEALMHYFEKRNISYRIDDMKTPMLQGGWRQGERHTPSAVSAAA